MPGRTFRVFVSSTFRDLKAERNALARWVFPRLRALCESRGYKFQAVDLRWGVRNEAAADQQTVRICLDEIARCQRLSPRPNFIVLLGDRYGWRPPPRVIPADEVERLRPYIEADPEADPTLRVFGDPTAPYHAEPLAGDGWYQLDSNAVPAEYVLQPRRGTFEDYETWKPVERQLRAALARAAERAGLGEPARRKFRASATELEVMKGVVEVDDAREHVFAFFRSIANLNDVKTALPGEAAIDLVDSLPDKTWDLDAWNAQGRLKEMLREKLGKANVWRYQPKWIGARRALDLSGILVELPADTAPPPADAALPDTSSLCEAVWQRLSRVIAIEMDKLDRENRDPLEVEKRAHAEFGAERSRGFVGRQELLDKIAAYLSGGPAQPLVIHGPSGSGKSALMARASQDAMAARPTAVVIRRFIGATPPSFHGFELLEGVGEQINAQCHATVKSPADVDALMCMFNEWLRLATADRPIMVFLDAIDQLASNDPARALAWLGAVLPPHCRVVISTTEVSEVLKRSTVLQLDPLGSADAELAVHYWLKAAGRTLSQPQTQHIVAAYTRCQLALYLKLASEEARYWRRHQPLDKCTLGEGIDGAVRTLLRRLSLKSNHGPILVSHALGCLAASRHGLAEDELLDVLSNDHEIWNDFSAHDEWKDYEIPDVMSGGECRLPVILWSRLFLDLKPYLTEQTVDHTLVMQFSHRQVRAAITDSYLADGTTAARHLSLAERFERECTQGNHFLPKKRPLREVAYHYRFGNASELKRIYANLSYICAYLSHHSAFTLRDEMNAAPPECSEPELRALIGQSAVVLNTDPAYAPQLLYKELASKWFRDQAEQLSPRPWIRVDPVAIPRHQAPCSTGVVPVMTASLRVQAGCVAVKREPGGIAFLHTSPTRIDVFRTTDLTPRGQIVLPPTTALVIKALFCDWRGRLLALVHDNGEIHVLETHFDPGGELVSAPCIHQGTALTGKFGSIAASSSPDGITYQASDRRVIALQLDASSELSIQSAPPDARTLLACFTSNVHCRVWRDGRDCSVAFPETGQQIGVPGRILAVARFGDRLGIATETGEFFIHRYPDLRPEKTIACRNPILSASGVTDDLLLLTDRYGNILSLDAELQLTDHGRCSTDVLEDYPSAIHPAKDPIRPAEHRVFYLSQRRCVILTVGGGEPPRDIMSVDGDDPAILTYTRARGYELLRSGQLALPLRQEIVGQQYEFEFSRFKVAWNANDTVAYTSAISCVVVDDGVRPMFHHTGSEIIEIRYAPSVDGFVVLDRSGVICLVDTEAEPTVITMPHSVSGRYLIEPCGTFLCGVAFEVLHPTAAANAFAETVISFYRLSRAGRTIRAELVDQERINQREPHILALSYHPDSNTVCFCRDGCIERCVLDPARIRERSRTPLAIERHSALPFCAGERGVFYVDVDNRLRYQPWAIASAGAALPCFRTITSLSPTFQKSGWFVEDNQRIFRFALEE